jgi:hypothetical protein
MVGRKHRFLQLGGWLLITASTLIPRAALSQTSPAQTQASIVWRFDSVVADSSPTPTPVAISPSTILADPSSYEGKPVSVLGKVASFQSQKMGSATVTSFQLCDTACVQVIDQTGASQYADGDQATASGTFHATIKGPRLTFNNVILITRTK